LTFPAAFASQKDSVVRAERHAFALRFLQGGEIDSVGRTPPTCEKVGSPKKRQSGLGAKDRPLPIGRDGSIGDAGLRVYFASVGAHPFKRHSGAGLQLSWEPIDRNRSGFAFGDDM
jgi:hypothetical protein